MTRSDLVKFPPVSHENLIRLGEDLLRAFSAARVHGISNIYQCQSLYTRLGSAREGGGYMSLISGLILRDGFPVKSLSSIEEATLTEAFNKVLFLRQVFSQSLTFLVVRLSWSYLPPRSTIPGQTCGSGSMPTPSSVNPEFSPTWNCVTNVQTTRPLAPQIFGRDVVMGSWCALKRFGYGIRLT